MKINIFKRHCKYIAQTKEDKNNLNVLVLIFENKKGIWWSFLFLISIDWNTYSWQPELRGYTGICYTYDDTYE